MFKKLYIRIRSRIRTKISHIKICIKVKKLMDNENELIDYLKSLESKIILCDNDEKNVIVCLGEILQICIIVYSTKPELVNNEEIKSVLDNIKPYMNSIDIDKYL